MEKELSDDKAKELISNNIMGCCIPDSDGKIIDEDEQDKKLDKQIKRMKQMAEMQQLLPPPPPKSLTDMLGGPSITSQLGPILSGVSKMISTMPTKTKLEGNINGGNFAIEIVDTITCHMAIDFLNQIMKNFEDNPPPVTLLAKKRKKE